MTTATSAKPATRKPRAKPARSIRLCLKPDGLCRDVVHITVGKEAADYYLIELAVEFGRGFEVEKIGGTEKYAVHIDGEKRSCECKGHTRHGHCKHSDGLAALIAAGKL
jgi:hypothetical protein